MPRRRSLEQVSEHAPGPWLRVSVASFAVVLTPRYVGGRVADPKAEISSDAPKRKKKQSPAAMRRELQELATSGKDAADKPPVDLKKAFTRVGIIVGVIWVVALFLLRLSIIPVIVAGVLTLAAVGLGVWVVRYVNKSRQLGKVSLRSAGQTEQGRKDALKRLESDFKKGDVQATLARAQLEMQDDPRRALATLESVDLAKRSLGRSPTRCVARGHPIHLQLGEVQEAKALVEKRWTSASKQEPKPARCSRRLRARCGDGAGRARRRSSFSKSSTPTTRITPIYGCRCGARARLPMPVKAMPRAWLVR